MISEKRLQQKEGFDPETYSGAKAQTLDEGFAESQEKFNLLKPKLRIDLKEALAEGRQLSVDIDETEKQGLSIADIRARALKNNLSLQIVQFDPQIAQSVLGAEQAKFDNIIYASLRRSREGIPRSSGDIVNVSSTNPLLNEQQVKLELAEQQSDYLEGEAGIAIPLRTGGVVTLSTPFERKRTSGVLGSDEYRRATRFSISQPLLRNAGREVNEASIRIAELGKQAVDAKTRLQSIRVLSVVDKAYWDLYAAWAELEIRHQQYELATGNLAMVLRMIEEGLVASIEGSRAEIGVSDRIEALIVARTRLQMSQRQLKFLLNDPQYSMEAEVMISPESDPILLRYEFDRDRLVTLAMQDRLDLLELELQLAADLNQIQYLENQTLPLFTLDYSYGALSTANDNLSGAYRNPFDNRFNDWSVGLRFELPMTNEVRLNQLQQAVQQRMQRLTTKDLQQLTVKREIYDALDQTEQQWQRIITSRQQAMLAGVNYEAELKQFNEGLRNMTEVLEMLSRLGEAQVKEIRAVVDYQVSLIDLAYTTGTLLGYSKVEFGN